MNDTNSLPSGRQSSSGAGVVMHAENLPADLLNLPDLLVVEWTTKGEILRFSGACQNLTGFTSAEVVGHCMWDAPLISSESAGIRLVVEAAHGGTVCARYESHWMDKRGQTHRIAWLNQVKNEGGHKSVLSVGVEMSPDQADATALRESQARFAGIIDSAMDAIITIDERQSIRLFNKAAQKMFRCSAEDAIGKPLATYMPTRFREAHSEHVKKFGASHVTDRSMGNQKPLMALRADGEEFPIEASISQVEVAGQKLFTAIVRDISGRLRNEQMLREMEARYRTIYQHAGLGILMIDHAGRIVDANPACERLFAFSAEELRLRAYDTILHPHDARLVQIHRLLDDSQSASDAEMEVRFIAKDKRRVWARVIHTVVRDALLAPLYFIAVIEDISQRKRTEKHIKRLRVRHEGVLNRLGHLTDREREVLWLMVEGKATKVIASDLGTSPKTIDVHRGRVMAKMEAESLAQLVQMVLPIRKYVRHLTLA